MCPKCGAQFDVSGLEPRERFECGVCGHVLRGRHARPKDPAVLRARKRAYRICQLAGTLGGGALIAVLILYPFVGSLIAVLALPMGIAGLVMLARAGMGPTVEESVPGAERLAARMTRSAKRWGWIGVICSVVALVVGLLVVYLIAPELFD
jgi:hypothetical protein